MRCEGNIVNHRRNNISVAPKTPAIIATINKDSKHAIFKRLMRDVGNNKFMIRDTGRDRITILPNDKAVHADVMKSLDEQLIGFHTFKTKNEILFAYMIRGLPEWVTADEINDGLKQAGISILSAKNLIHIIFVRINVSICQFCGKLCVSLVSL